MKFSVNITSQADWDKISEAMEKYTDWRWTSGKKPTEFNPYRCWEDEYPERKSCCVVLEDEMFWNARGEGDNKGRTIISIDTALLMLEWPEGTRVRATDGFPKGQIGTVVGWRNDGNALVVAFDNYDKGYSGILSYYFYGENKTLLTGKNGYFMEPKKLEKLDDNPLYLTFSTYEYIDGHFPGGKTFKELGLDKNRKFVMVYDGHCKFEKGDVLEWVKDEDTIPLFRRLSDGEKYYCGPSRLAYYEGGEPLTACHQEPDLDAIDYVQTRIYKQSIPITNLSPKPTLMSTLTSALRKLVRPEPQKTYVELGITDESGELTPDGKTTYLQSLFDSNEQGKDGQFYKDMKKVLEERKKADK